MDIKQVTETIAMIEEQNFDVRTITMGISLLDCIDPDINKAADKIYKKVVEKAGSLVAVGDEIAAELGIPIVNKRVSVTPISIIGAATDATDYLPWLMPWIRLRMTLELYFIGGFFCFGSKGLTKKEIKSLSTLFLVRLQKLQKFVHLLILVRQNQGLI